jgi:TetR/AcrR family transcriptional repressor of nem operon
MELGVAIPVIDRAVGGDSDNFDENIERSVDDEQRRGCMLVNAALELAPHDPEFQKLVAEEMVFNEAFFRRCIEAGQKDGAIADAGPADELAKLLLLAIRVLARTRLPRALQTFEADRCASNIST